MHHSTAFLAFLALAKGQRAPDQDGFLTRGPLIADGGAVFPATGWRMSNPLH
jgi:hypothetical protein